MRAGPSPTPFDAMLPGINDLFDFVTDSVQASDIARVGIITFADSARVHFPLARISASYTLPRLPTNGSETNFAAVFELLGKTMKADIANLCLLYTSDAADERSSVDLGGRRIIKKKNNIQLSNITRKK